MIEFKDISILSLSLFSGAMYIPDIQNVYRDVNIETKEARGKAVELKQRRQMQAEKSREKLRLAFLKKQVEKLKSSEVTGVTKPSQEQARS